MFDTLGRITQLRINRNFSVYKLAKLSGIPQSTIATWYQKNLCPPIDKLELLCDVFGITLSEFFATGNLIELTEDQKEILDKWFLLTAPQKKCIFYLIDTIAENKAI